MAFLQRSTSISQIEIYPREIYRVKIKECEKLDEKRWKSLYKVLFGLVWQRWKVRTDTAFCELEFTF
jgi:hypothetical protein